MSTLHVICKIGDSEYAIAGDDVFQMETYSGATPVPGAPAYVVGLVQVRQRIIPVLDLRLRFGFEPIPRTLESRVIVLSVGSTGARSNRGDANAGVNSGERLIGILVDSAREVQNIATEQFLPPPELIAQQSSGFVKSVVQLKNRIIMLLDSEKVVGEGGLHA